MKTGKHESLTSKDVGKMATCCVEHNGFKKGQRKKVTETIVMFFKDNWLPIQSFA